MRHCSASDSWPRAGRHYRVPITLAVVLAGLAVALLLGGCGSGGGDTATAQSGSSATSAQTTPDAAPATTWTRQNSKSAVTNAQLTSVTFVDASHGWTVGFGLDANKDIAGLILATSDGGATWKMQDASGAGSAKLNSVAFVDAAHGWAAGEIPDISGGSTPVILATGKQAPLVSEGK